VTGQHIDITAAGTRLRPWRIRYLTPDQLDEMAARCRPRALLELTADWTADTVHRDDPAQMSRYQRQPVLTGSVGSATHDRR
jgi:hypothetical protein